MLKKYESPRIIVPRFNEASGFYTTPQRSKQMSKIRAKDTKAEVLLRKQLWHSGIRYRKHLKKLPGSPDIVLTKAKIAIFVDGEFWHGHNWEVIREKIKSNRAFWIPKIERNIQRDGENNQALSLLGYKVVRFWEKEIKSDLNSCVIKIISLIQES